MAPLAERVQPAATLESRPTKGDRHVHELMASGRRLELLAQEEILEKEVVAPTEDSRKGVKQEREEGEHRPRIAGLASGDGPMRASALLRVVST